MYMRIVKAIAVAALLASTPAVLTAQTEAGVSEAGAALYRDYQASQRADLLPLFKRRSELQAQFDGLMKPEGYDGAKLEATMTEMRQIEGQIVEKQGTGLLALLRAMSDEDRTKFLQSMSKAPPALSARTSPPGDGPGR
jgi:uncharacterized membrane protein